METANLFQHLKQNRCAAPAYSKGCKEVTQAAGYVQSKSKQTTLKSTTVRTLNDKKNKRFVEIIDVFT